MNTSPQGTTRRTIRVALVGAGMAGQAHAFGYRNAAMAADLAGLRVELAHVVDYSADLAADVADRYGFTSHGSDLTGILDDPTIDVVSVALPNSQHADVLGRLLDTGKHVLTEKPLGMDAQQARSLAASTLGREAVAAVGFSYRRIPGLAALAAAARDGSLGEILHFEASYHASYAANPAVPHTWRFEQSTSGGGALIDLGAHALDAIEFTVGEISEVLSADFRTFIPERPSPSGPAPVTNDDFAALLLRTDSGASGSLQTSRVAQGVPNRLSITVFGTRGHGHFSTEDYNDFTLYQVDADSAGRDGARRIVTGPEHPHFADVSPFRSRGVGTGYGQAFIAQIQNFLRACYLGGDLDTDFTAAARTMSVIEAAELSFATRSPATVRTVAGATT